MPMSPRIPPAGPVTEIFAAPSSRTAVHLCGDGVTRTVVEHVAPHSLVSMTVTRTEWDPDPKEFVKLTLAMVGGPPAATRLVRTALPSTDTITISSSPSASATWTDTAATNPPEVSASNVVEVGQRTVGAVLRS